MTKQTSWCNVKYFAKSNPKYSTDQIAETADSGVLWQTVLSWPQHHGVLHVEAPTQTTDVTGLMVR